MTQMEQWKLGLLNFLIKWKIKKEEAFTIILSESTLLTSDLKLVQA